MRYGNTVALGIAALVTLTAVPTPSDAAAARGNGQVTLRSQVDAARGRIWWLTGAGLVLEDRARRHRITLPLPGWHWAGAPYGCQPALTIGPKGEVIVTSDVLPKLWRVDPETLAVSVHTLALDAETDRDVGFSALSYSARHGAYFARGSTPGSLWRIDPYLSRAQATPLALTRNVRCGMPSAHASAH